MVTVITMGLALGVEDEVIVKDIATKVSRDNVRRFAEARARRIQIGRGEVEREGGSASDLQGKVQINVGKYANEDHIFIHPRIAEVLKPHQIKGINDSFKQIIITTTC